MGPPVVASAKYAVFAVFFVNSAVLGNWVPRIPDVKSALALGDAELGMCLLAIPAGTLVGLTAAGRVVEVTGLRRGCQWFLPMWALLFMLPAFAATMLQLIGALLLCGVAVGLVEVVTNTEADYLERLFGQRLMSRCHGFWSLGSMIGALTGSALAQIGIGVVAHFLGIMALLAIAGFAAASALPRVSDYQRGPVATGPVFRLPQKALLGLCMMPLGIMAVEGAFIDWSAVFMRAVLDAPPIVLGVTYAFFSLVMALTRLFGDAVAERYGDLKVVRCSALSAVLGIGVFALAPTVPVALVGAVFSGMGVAIVYPLAVSAAARRDGRSAADNVAAITMVSFSAFFLAPPVIGLMAELASLRIALLALVPAAMATLWLSDHVKR